MYTDDFLEDLGIGKTPLAQLLDNLTEEYWSHQFTSDCEGWPNKSITYFYNSCGKISFTHSKKRKITEKTLRKEIFKRLKDKGWDYLTWLKQERRDYERYWLKRQPQTWQEVRESISPIVKFKLVYVTTSGDFGVCQNTKDIPKDAFKVSKQPIYYCYDSDTLSMSNNYTWVALDDSEGKLVSNY